MLHSTGAVAAAVGVDLSVLRGWFDRGLIPIGQGGRDADGRGVTREIPFNTALQVAVAAELVRLGFIANRAARLALSFSDTGSATRLPGKLFPDDKTLLLAWPHLQSAKIVRASELVDVFDAPGTEAHSVAIVDLNAIFLNVAARLGEQTPDAARN